ncbi:Malate dehydrogenase [Geodia barretti]|uniref:L-lactate dehydrogenase n=1 Tax=Geodia barretti TaxID=519541 RepID=A0AA35TQJ3_GEOBA|nr:Malate dehydrogenase [Geodia barretti]
MLAKQTQDPELQARFSGVARQLADNEDKIVQELIDAQGQPVDIGGYYHPNDEMAAKAMRPSATLNAIRRVGGFSRPTLRRIRPYKHRSTHQMRSKVTVVGAGNVGATTAQRIHQLGYADVVLVDVVEDLPQGKSLDMLESGPVLGTDAMITGSNGYEATADSEVVVITAGIARRPGMSRDDLLLTNMRITSAVTEEVVRYSPDCIILAVTNPLDAMVQNVYETAGFPRNRVFGMAGVLDTARYRTFIAQELDVSVEDVQAMVLGGHGDDMVPLVRYTTVGSIPVTELLSKDRIDSIVQRTRDGGGEIVALLKQGSAFYAPSAAITQMVEAMLLDKKRILPGCAYLEGEYGINGLCVGVPVKIGAKGVEQIVEISLTDEEQAALQSSAASVQELVDVMSNAKAEAG